MRLRLLNPSLIFLATRMLAWALLLPFLKRIRPLPDVVRIMHRRPSGKFFINYCQQDVIAVAGRIYRSAQGKCLEKSLLLYRYLLATGNDPKLAVGFRKMDRQWMGHSWVIVGNCPIDEPAAALKDFSRLLIFNSDGAIEVMKDGF